MSVALTDVEEKQRLVNRCARAGWRARDQLLGRARASISVGGGWDQSRGTNIIIETHNVGFIALLV